MRLKLTHSEFEGIYNILSVVIASYKPKEVYGRLLYAIALSMYTKFYGKAIVKNKQYSIKLSDIESLAFYELFSDHNLRRGSHEANLVDKINLQIHQQYFTK